MRGRHRELLAALRAPASRGRRCASACATGGTIAPRHALIWPAVFSIALALPCVLLLTGCTSDDRVIIPSPAQTAEAFEEAGVGTEAFGKTSEGSASADEVAAADESMGASDAELGQVGLGPALLDGAKPKPLVAPSEATGDELAPEVELDTYADPEGAFTMLVPRGWEVVVETSDDPAAESASFAISVRDPTEPGRWLYYGVMSAAGVKSQDAHDFYADNYGEGSHRALLPVVNTCSAAELFEDLQGSYGLRDLAVTRELGTNPLGCELLEASCVSILTGERLDGLLGATISVGEDWQPLRSNMVLTGPYVDVGLVEACTVVIMTAPEGESDDLLPTLTRCLGSISFSQAFLDARAEQWQQAMA